MASNVHYGIFVMAVMACGTLGQFPFDQGLISNSLNSRFDTINNGNSLGNMIVQATPVPAVPNCPLEVHPDTETMFIMRGPLGDPEPRTCPPMTVFMRSLCSCVNRPIEKCNLRPSARGPEWYEEYVFGLWIQRPCGPGSGYNAITCDCSLTV